MPLTTIHVLIERLEKATGPDRALNALIYLDVLNPHMRAGWTAPNGIGPEGYYARVSPDYTGSIDAALTLVPEGFQAYVDTGTPEGAHACVWTDYPHRISGGARQCTQPAIALCTAALRARRAAALTPNQ
jgi:hypothetical protein